MNRMNRPLRLAAILLLGLLTLGLEGCKKQPFIQVVEQTLYLGMPASVTHLASLDMNQLRRAEGFNETLHDLETTTNPQVRSFLDAMHNKVGIDPFKDVGQAIMGLRGVAPDDPMKNAVFIFSGNFKDGAAKVDKLAAWLSEEYLADVQKAPGQHPSGAPTIRLTGKSQYDVKKTYEINFAFPTETMMLFSLSGPLMNEALDVISGQVPGLQKDKIWMETLKRPNTGAPVWAIGNFTEFVAAGANASPVPVSDQVRSIRQYFFDLSVAPDFVVHIGLVCENIDAADKLAKTMRSGFDQAKAGLGMLLFSMPETMKLINSVQILNELEVARISLRVTAEDQRKLMEELPRLQQMVQPGAGMMPPGGGMMPPGNTPGMGAPPPGQQ